VTVGIVSARNRNINSGPYDDFIQTDASINRGNSGGPMFDMEGKVIGVNTMIFSPTGTNIGIGFAIPSNQVKQVVGQLIEFGKTRRGWMGVTIQSVTDEVAESLGLDNTEGAIISSVVPGGPSDEAGIEPGDIIIDFNGVKVPSSEELPTIVANTTIGVDVEVRVLRDGEEITFTLTTGELENNFDEEEVSPEEEETRTPPEGDKFLGMLLKPLEQSDREQLEIPEDIEGVLIETLSRRSEAATRGIRPGDVIVQVNLRDVGTVRDVEEAVTAARRLDRSTVLFRIYREGAYFHVPLPIDSGE
ncbi:MAG: PDZ domain-containing protein, partial [Sphingomonadales bacterium]